MPIEVNRVLVPVDGSEDSREAVDYALAVADKYGAVLHVLYVFGEAVARGLETGDIDEESIAQESKIFTEEVKTMAEPKVTVHSAMAFGFSPVRKTMHPGSVILDCADEIDVDFLVIPRESTCEKEGDVLERAAEYVLLYASQPVLSV